MADRTPIEWTDATWNPITGCSVASPGCTNCYAMRLAGTRLRHHPSRIGLTRETKGGPVWTGEVRLNEDWLTQPLGWGRSRKIFVCAHGDLFHEAVPDEWIDRVFAVMALASQHTFQVLTKRSARMRTYLHDEDLNDRISATLGDMLDGGWIWEKGKWHRPAVEQMISIFLGEDADDEGYVVYHDDPMPLPNVWLGVSAEDQRRADERIPDLLATPAAVRFASAEPLLGAIRFDAIACPHGCLPPDYCNRCHPDGGTATGTFDALATGELNQIIVGGESGPGARPMHPQWARDIRDQCAAAGVPFYFKQWGAWEPVDLDAARGVADWQILGADGDLDLPDARSPDDEAREVAVRCVGKARAGRLLDGKEHSGMPEAI